MGKKLTTIDTTSKPPRLELPPENPASNPAVSFQVTKFDPKNLPENVKAALLADAPVFDMPPGSIDNLAAKYSRTKTGAGSHAKAGDPQFQISENAETQSAAGFYLIRETKAKGVRGGLLLLLLLAILVGLGLAHELGGLF